MTASMDSVLGYFQAVPDGTRLPGEMWLRTQMAARRVFMNSLSLAYALLSRAAFH
jgi:hypothetical protein